MHVDSYSFGSMTVNGRTYNTDLIIFPERVSPNWWRKEGHSLAIGDLDKVIKYKPEVLIVGKGASGCMEIPSSTQKDLEKKHIELIARNTDEAYKLFNEHVTKDRKVVGAFHLTC